MGQHSAKPGQKSTSESNVGGNGGKRVERPGKHRADEKPAGSDVPPRGKGLK